MLKNSRSWAKSKVHWCCDRYDMGAGKIISVVTQISRRQDEMEEKMKAQEKELASVKQLAESQEHWVQTNDNKIVEIQENLEKSWIHVKRSWATGYRPADDSKNSSHRETQGWWESNSDWGNLWGNKNVADRLDRQSNAILFNLTDSKSNLKAEVMTHNVTWVKQLCLATAGKEVSFSCKRLGRKTLCWQTGEGDNGRSTSPGHGDNNGDDNATPHPNSNRPRPLLVQFTEPEEKAAVMKNLFKLADDEVPDHISCVRVKHDMTQEEREIEKWLQLEAKQENEAKTDLNFRHVVRGTPGSELRSRWRCHKQNKISGATQPKRGWLKEQTRRQLSPTRYNNRRNRPRRCLQAKRLYI